MKSNELMIGDWVQFRDEFNEVTGPYEIDLITNDEIAFKGEMFARVFNNSIEPIPLSSEILKKNGFEARGYEELTLETDEYCFALQKGVDWINAWWWEMFASPIIPINHVHELQHCLKLVGIDKEIVL